MPRMCDTVRCRRQCWRGCAMHRALWMPFDVWKRRCAAVVVARCVALQERRGVGKADEWRGDEREEAR